MNIIQITALGWVGGVVAIVFFVWAIVKWNNKEKRIMQTMVGIDGSAVRVVAILLYFNGTAVGGAQLKAWQAQSAGIQRHVEVYSMSGDLLKDYSGVCNIEYTDTRVEIFDVNTGERILVYYQNGTIIVTEAEVSN
jgi:thiol:disulfide interchange protein